MTRTQEFLESRRCPEYEIVLLTILPPSDLGLRSSESCRVRRGVLYSLHGQRIRS